MEQNVDVAIQSRDRTIGLVYLGYFVAAFTAAYLAKGIVVPADGAATATNLFAHESLFRASVALTFASVNIFGGFLVTQRMLAMYKKKVK